MRWHMELTCTPVGDAVVCHAQEFPPKSWEDFVDAYDRGRSAGVHSARYFGVAVEQATKAVHTTTPASDWEDLWRFKEEHERLGHSTHWHQVVAFKTFRVTANDALEVGMAGLGLGP